MRVFLLIAISLLTLGITIILFEGLVLNNKTNFHPCPADLICEFLVPTEFYFGLFPAIAGVVMLGIHRVISGRRSESGAAKMGNTES
ncbi:MAG TPA: hypothetical protein VIB07_02030 [Nitrososphaera sp.]